MKQEWNRIEYVRMHSICRVSVLCYTVSCTCMYMYIHVYTYMYIHGYRYTHMA